MSDLKPTILVSACLLGQAVRYDGGHRYSEIITRQFSQQYKLLSCCPEMGAGLGVPRPPVQLVSIADTVSALGVDDNTLDVTTALQQFSHHYLQHAEPLHGAIVKARSPSCGVGSTPLYDEHGSLLGLTNGLFVQALQHYYPSLPIIDEQGLANKDSRAAFRDAVLSYANQQRKTSGSV